MGFILKNNKNSRIIFWTGLPTYIGILIIGTLLFPKLFGIHWIWFFLLWIVLDIAFDVVYQHTYKIMHQKEMLKKGHVTKWFHYKAIIIQIIIMTGIFIIASPYY